MSTTQLWNFPNGKLVDEQSNSNASQSWQSWFAQVTRVLSGLSQAGTTADRPADVTAANGAIIRAGLYVGRMYYDTTLHQPIWYDPDGTPGSLWRDATGTFV